MVVVVLERKKFMLYLTDQKDIVGGFPGGAVVKNLPANAGDTGSRALVWEDPTCRGVAGPVSHNY